MIKTVGDLLTFLYARGKRRDLVAIDIGVSPDEALARMEENGIHLLVVSDGKEYVGITTDTNLKRSSESALRPSERTIETATIRTVVTVSPEDDLDTAAAKLIDGKIRHIVVADWRAILDSNEVLEGTLHNNRLWDELRQMHAEAEFRSHQ